MRMNDFHHEFDHVEDYLHHRAPYLMVEEIISIEGNEITTRASVTTDAHFLDGHFPGAPIVPGAMLQELATQTGGILIAARYNPMEEYDTHDPFANEYALGVLVRVMNARFRHFARPGDALTCRAQLQDRVGDLFSFSARVTTGSTQLVGVDFQLTNIPSAKLAGAESAL